MDNNTVAYVIWCNEDGKVVDDGTVFCLNQNEFKLCCAVKMQTWLKDSAEGFDLEISDVTDDIAALSVQGPTSCSVLKNYGATDLELLKPFESKDFTINGYNVLISRTKQPQLVSLETE